MDQKKRRQALNDFMLVSVLAMMEGQVFKPTIVEMPKATGVPGTRTKRTSWMDDMPASGVEEVMKMSSIQLRDIFSDPAMEKDHEAAFDEFKKRLDPILETAGMTRTEIDDNVESIAIGIWSAGARMDFSCPSLDGFTMEMIIDLDPVGWMDRWMTTLGVKSMKSVRDEWRKSFAEENKRQLRAMPPGAKLEYGSKLYYAHSNYSSRTGSSYDPVYDAEMRVRQPKWYSYLTRVPGVMKHVDEMPKGAPKPTGKEWSDIAKIMWRYPAWGKKQREKHPDWFALKCDDDMRRLHGLAKRGDPRPNGISRDGLLVTKYMHKAKKGNKYEAWRRAIEDIPGIHPSWLNPGSRGRGNLVLVEILSWDKDVAKPSVKNIKRYRMVRNCMSKHRKELLAHFRHPSWHRPCMARRARR